jgi:hypothetical protein
VLDMCVLVEFDCVGCCSVSVDSGCSDVHVRRLGDREVGVGVSW